VPDLRQPVVLSEGGVARPRWRRAPWRHPATYLCLLGILVGLALLDGNRAPERQVTARLYMAAVRCYQAVGRPLLRGHIQCRYRPTCSEYSLAAVRAHGIRRGLALTARRIASCRPEVPLGTIDLVPAAASAAGAFPPPPAAAPPRAD
jgi:putative membrane protein insertion efficiency factor